MKILFLLIIFSYETGEKYYFYVCMRFILFYFFFLVEDNFLKIIKELRVFRNNASMSTIDLCNCFIKNIRRNLRLLRNGLNNGIF